MDRLDPLRPKSVINAGDLSEGYSDDKAELNAEWDESDKMLSTLKMPFFRAPGNHDIANKIAQQVWREAAWFLPDVKPTWPGADGGRDSGRTSAAAPGAGG